MYAILQIPILIFSQIEDYERELLASIEKELWAAKIDLHFLYINSIN